MNSGMCVVVVYVILIVLPLSMASPPKATAAPPNRYTSGQGYQQQYLDPKRQHFFLGAARYGLPGSVGVEVCYNYIYSFDTRAQHPLWVLEHLTFNTVRRRLYLCDLSPICGYSFNPLITDQLMCSSNVFPQLPALNRGPWMRLEKYVEHVAKLSENIHVVTGSLYSPIFQFGTFEGGNAGLFKYNIIGPSYFYKIFVSESFAGEFSMEAFVMPYSLDDNGHMDLNEFRVDINQGLRDIERSTGLVFFAKLDKTRVAKPRNLQYNFLGQLNAYADFVLDPAVTRYYLRAQHESTKTAQSGPTTGTSGHNNAPRNNSNVHAPKKPTGNLGSSSANKIDDRQQSAIKNKSKFKSKPPVTKPPTLAYVRKQSSGAIHPGDSQEKGKEPMREAPDSSSSSSSTGGSKEQIVWKIKNEEPVAESTTELAGADAAVDDERAEIEREINSIIEAMGELDLNSKHHPAVSGKAREFLSHATRFGLPSNDNLRLYDNLVLSYDRRLKHPIWMLEHLTDRQKQVKCADRRMSLFSLDEGTHDESLESDRVCGSLMLCFSNIAPQAVDCNRGPWLKLETYIDELARISKNMYVLTGALYQSDAKVEGLKSISYNVIGENEVGVPTHLYKVWVRENKNGRLSMEAFKVPNHSPNTTVNWMSYRIDIDKDLPVIEKSTGLVFFEKLDRSKVIKISPKLV